MKPAAPAKTAGPAVKGSVTVLIVRRPFLRLTQDLVSFTEFLKILFRNFIAGILIGVKLDRESAVSLFDFLFGCAFLQTEHGVIVAFGHGNQSVGLLETITVAGRSKRSRSL